MTTKELMPKFPPACYVNKHILIVNPKEFRRLEGVTINNSRIFMMVCSGEMDILLNGEECIAGSGMFFDCIDTTTIHIKRCDSSLRAWCVMVTFEFARQSLKNMRPVPFDHLGKPIITKNMSLSPKSTAIIEQQLTLLASAVANKKHFYHKELSELFYKSFCLELGNAIMASSQTKDKPETKLSRKDFATLNFMKLVTKHFAREHSIGFYAQELNVSPKHLARMVKELTGKTPHNIICDELTHEAMALLEDDRMSVRSISERLCFSDQAAFCKFFKKQIGISPMEYRMKSKTFEKE